MANFGGNIFGGSFLTLQCGRIDQLAHGIVPPLGTVLFQTGTVFGVCSAGVLQSAVHQ